MDPQRWSKVDELFHAALARPADARAKLVAQLCGSDAGLRAEVESLLTAHERASSFVELPAFVVRPEPVAGEMLVGRLVGQYRILHAISAGGMGIVYAAEQERPRRMVALKLVRPGLFSPELLGRLEHEAQLLGRLQHPGIAQIYEAGTADAGFGPQPFFAMELIAGEPITTYVEQRGLPVREQLEIFVLVCEAVEHAHERGIIHRDLKPANILVTPEGRPKVLDFGIARTLDGVDSATCHTGAGQLIGTVPYMSPEQIAGDSAPLDRRSDVYSLGVLCCELLTGRLPYDLHARGLPEAARVIREDEPQRLSALNPALRGDLEMIVAKALEKDRDRRYPTAAQLAADIRRYLRHEPIVARAPSLRYQLGKLAVRHKVPFALAAVLFLVVTASALVGGWLAVRGARQRDIAVAAQRSEATARRSAEQVVEFLVSLFEKGDPETAQDNEPTVHDLLAAGAERVRTDLAGQPLVQARLMTALGAAHAKLCDFEAARTLIQAGLDIRRRQLGTSHPDVAESLLALADLESRSAQAAAGLEHLQEALAIRCARFGQDHALVADVVDALAANRFYGSDFDAALRYFLDVLDRRVRVHGADSREATEARSNVGITLVQLGRIDEAEQYLRDTLAAQQRLLGNHTSTALTLNHIAHLMFARGRLDEAARFARERVDMLRQFLHARHPGLLHALHNYAFLVQRTEGAPAAEPIHREILEKRIASLGAEHELVAVTLHELGAIHLELGDYQQAENELREALRIRRTLLGDSSEPVAWTAALLAKLCGRLGRFDEGEPLLLEAYRITVAQQGEASPEAGNYARLTAEFYEHWSRPETAALWRAKITGGDQGVTTSQSSTR